MRGGLKLRGRGGELAEHPEIPNLPKVVLSLRPERPEVGPVARLRLVIYEGSI